MNKKNPVKWQHHDSINNIALSFDEFFCLYTFTQILKLWMKIVKKKRTFLQYGTTKVKDASWMTSSISPLDGKLRAKMCGAICLKICALLTQDQRVSVL